MANRKRRSRVAPLAGDLRVVEAFVNTVDLRTGRDELSSPGALADWLVGWRLAVAGSTLEAADLERAREVREALRALIGANPRGQADPETVARLDQAAAEAPLRVRFGPGGTARFEPTGGGLAGALGSLFAIVARMRSQRPWRRLKLCANPECRRAYYDASPNQSGRWCSMKRCGSRLKTRAYRKRRGSETPRRVGRTGRRGGAVWRSRSRPGAAEGESTGIGDRQ